MSLEPDLILVSEGSAVVTPLSRGGAAVWAGSARRFEDVFRVIEVTGQLIGIDGGHQLRRGPDYGSLLGG